MSSRKPARTKVWDKAVRLFEQGFSYRQIAETLGYAYSTVQGELSARGLHPTNRKHDGTARRHGFWLYAYWRRIIRRCTDAKEPGYPKYGGVGIRVAPEWRDFDPFYDWAIAAGYRPGLQLDRRDRAGNLTPANCVWVKPGGLKLGVPGVGSPVVEAFGVRKTLAGWLQDKRCRVGTFGLHDRLRAGWPPEEALTGPPRSKPSHRVQPVLAPATGVPRRRHIDWSSLRQLYEVEQLSENQIARRLGTSRPTVVRHLRLAGVPRRRRPNLNTDPERHRLYATFRSLHARCELPRDIQYPFNGARGVRVARCWRDFEKFFAWAQATGARPGLWLVRRDYRKKVWSPSNVEWVTPEECRRHERPHGMPPARRMITAFGETKGIADWGRDPRCQVRDFTISRRLDKGWKPEDAIAAPSMSFAGPPAGSAMLKAFGEEKCKRDWLTDPRCRIFGHDALDLRLEHGWTVEDAITTPPWKRPRKVKSGSATVA